MVHVVRLEPRAHGGEVHEEEGGRGAIRDPPGVQEAPAREEMRRGQDHHQRPGPAAASRGHPRPRDEDDDGQIGGGEEAHRRRRGP